MTAQKERIEHYQRQNGSARLTPAQKRRTAHKLNHALASASGSHTSELKLARAARRLRLAEAGRIALRAAQAAAHSARKRTYTKYQTSREQLDAVFTLRHDSVKPLSPFQTEAASIPPRRGRKDHRHG